MPPMLKCESASRRFQPGEGPSRGLLRDCTTSPINRFAALIFMSFSQISCTGKLAATTSPSPEKVEPHPLLGRIFCACPRAARKCAGQCAQLTNCVARTSGRVLAVSFHQVGTPASSATRGRTTIQLETKVHNVFTMTEKAPN